MLNSLVSAKWLKDHLEDENLILLYTDLIAKSQSIPDEQKNIRIPGARYFDLKHIFSDQQSELPNTYPSPESFQEACRNLGINADSKIVVYDSLGIYSSPRVWFLFKSMGHKNVYVLDGGLQEWLRQGYEVKEKQEYQFAKGDFTAHFNLDLLKDRNYLLNNLENPEAIVVDARSSARFYGEVPEPREGLRSGHIPNSLNLHYARLLDDGKFKSEAEIKEIFTTLNLSDQPLVFSCGSGITACILYFAASEVTDNDLSVYDGSWTEWGSANET